MMDEIDFCRGSDMSKSSKGASYTAAALEASHTSSSLVEVKVAVPNSCLRGNTVSSSHLFSSSKFDHTILLLGGSFGVPGHPFGTFDYLTEAGVVLPPAVLLSHALIP